MFTYARQGIIRTTTTTTNRDLLVIYASKTLWKWIFKTFHPI